MFGPILLNKVDPYRRGPRRQARRFSLDLAKKGIWILLSQLVCVAALAVYFLLC